MNFFDTESEYKRNFKKFIKEIRREYGDIQILSNDSVYERIHLFVTSRTWSSETTTCRRVHQEILQKLAKKRNKVISKEL